MSALFRRSRLNILHNITSRLPPSAGDIVVESVRQLWRRPIYNPQSDAVLLYSNNVYCIDSIHTPSIYVLLAYMYS